MAIKYIRLGSSTNVFGYDDGTFPKSAEYPGPVSVLGTPVDPNDALRLSDIGGITIAAISVANIDDPSTELNALTGDATSLALVYQIGAGANSSTLYTWDDAITGSEIVPYIVDGATGYWIAIGGKYVASTMGIADTLTLPKTSGKGIKVDIASPTFGYRDLLGEIKILSPGASDPTLATFRDSIKSFSFSNVAMNEVYFHYHIPHDYVPSSDIFIHFHWAQNVVDSGGAAGAPGVVKWQAEVTYAKGHNQAAFPASFTTSVTQTASGTQYQHMLIEIQLSASAPSATQIDSDILEPDGLLIARIFRDPTDVADTLNQVPFLHHVDIHYQSTNIATKAKAPDFYT